MMNQSMFLYSLELKQDLFSFSYFFCLVDDEDLISCRIFAIVIPIYVAFFPIFNFFRTFSTRIKHKNVNAVDNVCQ